MTRVDQYLQFLEQARAALPDCVRYVVADGFYSKTKFINGVVEMGLHLMANFAAMRTCAGCSQARKNPKDAMMGKSI